MIKRLLFLLPFSWAEQIPPFALFPNQLLQGWTTRHAFKHLIRPSSNYSCDVMEKKEKKEEPKKSVRRAFIISPVDVNQPWRRRKGKKFPLFFSILFCVTLINQRTEWKMLGKSKHTHTHTHNEVRRTNRQTDNCLLMPVRWCFVLKKREKRDAVKSFPSLSFFFPLLIGLAPFSPPPPS